MALQSDAIENRLQGLRQEDRRPLYDSKLRDFRLDGKSLGLTGNRASKVLRKDDDEIPTELIVSLLEDIVRRIDGLEKTDRAFNKEVRRRAHWDSLWRILVTVSTIILGSALAGHWLVDLL